MTKKAKKAKKTQKTRNVVKAVKRRKAKSQIRPRNTNEEVPMGAGAQTVADLVAAVAAADNVFDSAVVFINGVPGLIQAAVDQALANGATEAELQPVKDVAADITNKAAAIQAALTQGTPTPSPAAARKAR